MGGRLSQEAGRQDVVPLPPRNPGPACDRVLRPSGSLRIAGPAAEASLIIRRLRTLVCCTKNENTPQFSQVLLPYCGRSRRRRSLSSRAVLPSPTGHAIIIASGEGDADVGNACGFRTSISPATRFWCEAAKASRAPRMIRRGESQACYAETT